MEKVVHPELTVNNKDSNDAKDEEDNK